MDRAQMITNRQEGVEEIMKINTAQLKKAGPIVSSPPKENEARPVSDPTTGPAKTQDAGMQANSTKVSVPELNEAVE